MGCDIHLHVEKRGEDGKWHWEKVVPQGMRDPWSVKMARDSSFAREFWSKCAEQCWYSIRNYDCFAILAGVCDYLDGGCHPIAHPKGLPIDMDPALIAAVERDKDGDCEAHTDFGDHSFSWLTLQELLDFDWEVVVNDRCGNDVTYREAASDFYDRVIPALKSLGGDPKNVRIVFGFDS